ncbi:Putative transposase (identified by ISEscan HMM) [Escherichia coli]|nr:Putative transposase (identified by ISEscan HMM) [Escherichia coli]
MIAAQSLAGYLRTLTDGQLLAIKTLSMDMNAGYIRAARIHLPSAVEKSPLTASMWRSNWAR